MNLYDNLKKDSIYIYGKIYELLDHLNNHNFKCYINNEKKVDLSKEFKYQKKKRVEFISILDYYARFKNKESEFLVLPIIFNKEYEILYLGVSMFFKENFSEEYKKNCYNYIELYIYNLDKNNVVTYENCITSNHNISIFKLLINLEDLKNSHKEEILKNDIKRIMNNRNNDQEVYLKNNNYCIDDKKNEHLCSQENNILKREENYLSYSNNIKYNNKNFNLGNNDYLIIYNTYNSLKKSDHLEESFTDYTYKIHTNSDINNTTNNHNNKNNININDNNNNHKCNNYINSNINIRNNNNCNNNINNINNNNNNNNENINKTNNSYNNNNNHDYNNNYSINSNINSMNNNHINNINNNNNNNNININNTSNNNNHKYSNNNIYSNINIINNNNSNNDNSNNNINNINYDINNNNNDNIDNNNKEYIKDEMNKNSSCKNNHINKVNHYENLERRSENEYNISEINCENQNINYQYYYFKERENLVLNIKKNDEIPVKIENSLNNNSEEKTYTSLKISESLQHNYMNTKVIINLDNDKLNEKVSYLKQEMIYNQNDYLKINDTHMNKYTEFMKDISIDNIIYKNYFQENNNNKNEKWKNFKSGFFSFKGNRTYNEDRVITIENINDFIKKEYNEIIKKKEVNETFDKEYYDLIHKLQNIETQPYMYCAIYDGHNGENTVNIVQKFLHLNVYSYLINGNGISNSLKYAFQSIDEHICKETLNNEEINHSNLSSGSTACVSIIFKSMLYIANIGDSRCVLSKNGRAIVLTVDHRASINKKEEERIIKSGGVLDDEGYLDGCLGVCRGFGSFDKKTKKKLKGLICEPDLFQIKLTDDDEFLIICCDGVFDVMTSQEAVNTVRASLVESTNANIASEALCRLAYKRKSLDNLSVVVVIFQNPEMKKKTSINENSSLYSSQTGRVRRRIKFSALKDLINP
ncbi:protein phosphatase PPM1, putative [Plasmodium relictum]|uniref:Protein phosphatase PPM1, putative n=1 Tax=Plasmodium relictum TaxID=85471 RepID=A0A1J1H1Q2_PLARL|nr:protein phosphatase PPM1, putative [Plasmodium relictum]CRG98588.1 protein phosphatase PPM1, putative [Plasmodium relictum]